MSKLGKAAREQLQTMLGAASAVSLASFLEYRKLAPGSKATFESQVERALELLDQSKLTSQDLEQFLLDHYESSAKRVFVFDAVIGDETSHTIAGLPKQRVVPRISDLKLTATEPTLCYTVSSSSAARIVWTEQHRSVHINKEGDGIINTPVPRVIVAQLDITKRRLWVMFDLPFRHSWGEGSADAYYQEYLLRARVMLGIGTTPSPLEGWVKSLEKAKHVAWKKLRGDSGKTTFSVNSKQGGGDLRNEDTYAVLQPKLLKRLGGEILWSDGAKSPLVRPLRTKIDCNASMVVFEQHTLRNELEYVLAQIP